MASVLYGSHTLNILILPPSAPLFGSSRLAIKQFLLSNTNSPAEFLIILIPAFEFSGYFKVRVGDFRTKIEAIKLFQSISKEFPGAYFVPDVINFPDLNIKQ